MKAAYRLLRLCCRLLLGQLLLALLLGCVIHGILFACAYQHAAQTCRRPFPPTSWLCLFFIEKLLRQFGRRKTAGALTWPPGNCMTTPSGGAWVPPEGAFTAPKADWRLEAVRAGICFKRLRSSGAAGTGPAGQAAAAGTASGTRTPAPESRTHCTPAKFTSDVRPAWKLTQ
eukprot:1733135-Rhodomonas_salina.3